MAQYFHCKLSWWVTSRHSYGSSREIVPSLDMSLPGKKGKEVIDGERHIYSVTSDAHCRIPQDHPKAAYSHPRVLTNTHMRNIGCWQQEKCTKKKDNNDKRGKGRGTHGVRGSHGPPSITVNDAGNAYRVPKICSSLHVAAKLIQAREMQPNVPHLLRTKLNSPNAAVNLKKQLSKEVNLPRSQSVFQELVSLDVSEGSLETQLKEALNIRAETGHQLQWPHDPEPQPVDILDPEEYVNYATITTSTSLSPPAACVQPQQLTSQELCISRLVKDFL